MDRKLLIIAAAVALFVLLSVLGLIPYILGTLAVLALVGIGGYLIYSEYK